MNLLASDFDNTLWFEDHMKEEDVKVIKEFQKHGNVFGVCTGRTLDGVVRTSKKYELEYDFYILLSGALILNKDKEVILERRIPMSLVKEIFEFVGRQNASVIYKDKMYQVYKEFNDDYRGVALQSFDELEAEEVSGFSFHYRDNQFNDAKIATQRINEKFGDYVTAFQNNQHIDLASKGCSKGQGMKIIQDYFHLDGEHIYGIGDSWNDLPMFNAIENSYSFTYAPLDVQQSAKVIVKSLADCIKDIEKNMNR